MARPQGRVVERESRNGTTYAIRFVAGGRRRFQTLGTSAQGWTRARAQTELQNALADVRRGIWQPPAPQVEVVRSADPTFHEFASEWFKAHKDEWRESTQLDYEWQLSHHLLKFFEHHRLSQITVREVDRFKTAKMAEARSVEAKAAEGKPIMDEYTDRRGCKHRRPRRALSVASINKMLTRLAQILESAVKYELIAKNPARGVRLKPVKLSPVWLESADQIAALLDAAGGMDKAAKSNGQIPRRAILATLVFAGLRIGELIELRWRDVDLAGGTITVRASKTDAGMRRIDLLPVLQDELTALKANTHAGMSDRVFPTQRGGAMNDSNVRTRILDRAVSTANEQLEKAGAVPIPAALTPHKLRHTYASLMVALGNNPQVIMEQTGHTDPSFTLRVYTHGMRRDQASKDRLRTLVGADVQAQPDGSGTISGTNSESAASLASDGNSQ